MNGPSVQADDALATRAQAEQRFDGFGAPAPTSPPRPRISPPQAWKDTSRTRGGAASRSISSAPVRRRAGRRGRLAVMAPISRPAMSLMMSGCVNPRVGSPAATVLPSRSTVTRSVIASTSSSRCETNASAWPASRSRVMTSNRRSTSLGLSEAVGSSNTISSASSARALAISINCRWAAERCRTSVSSGARPAWPREFRMAARAGAPRGEDAPAGPVRAGRGSRARSDPARVGFLHHDRQPALERVAGGCQRRGGCGCHRHRGAGGPR